MSLLQRLQSYANGSFDDCFSNALGVRMPRQASRFARYCALQTTGGQASAAALGAAASSGFDDGGRTSGGCVGDGRPSRCRTATSSRSQLRRGRSGGTSDPLQQCRGAPTVGIDASAFAWLNALCLLRFALAGASSAAAARIDTGFVSQHVQGARRSAASRRDMCRRTLGRSPRPGPPPPVALTRGSAAASSYPPRGGCSGSGGRVRRLSPGVGQRLQSP